MSKKPVIVKCRACGCENRVSYKAAIAAKDVLTVKATLKDGAIAAKDAAILLESTTEILEGVAKSMGQKVMVMLDSIRLDKDGKVFEAALHVVEAPDKVGKEGKP